jgi:hypothetical protein
LRKNPAKHVQQFFYYIILWYKDLPIETGISNREKLLPDVCRPEEYKSGPLHFYSDGNVFNLFTE